MTSCVWVSVDTNRLCGKRKGGKFREGRAAWPPPRNRDQEPSLYTLDTSRVNSEEWGSLEA